MDKVFIGFMLAFAMFMLASIGGTVLYFIWPVIAPVFHLPELSWFQSVCLVWATHIIIPGGTNTTTKN
jgi:hypothetical protein